MFDMSWGEIMVIGGVALIVIGPKDLPKALRTVGQMTTKVRRLAGEFQSQFSEAMREAELEDVRKELEGVHRDVSSSASSSFNPIQTIRDELKGAVEAQPASSAPAFTTVDVPGPATAVTDELSPLPEHRVGVDPGTLNPDAVVAEVQPLVPLPGDELSGPRGEGPTVPPLETASAGVPEARA